MLRHARVGLRLRAAVAVLGVTGALWVAAPAASWAAAGSPAGSGFCAKVTADIEPHHPHVGDSLSYGASWVNCADRQERIRFRLVFNGTCVEGVRERGHLRLAPGEGIAEANSGPVACRGVYHVLVEAYQGSQLLDSARRVVRAKP